jgi:hypothetical protein
VLWYGLVFLHGAFVGRLVLVSRIGIGSGICIRACALWDDMEREVGLEVDSICEDMRGWWEGTAWKGEYRYTQLHRTVVSVIIHRKGCVCR